MLSTSLSSVLLVSYLRAFQGLSLYVSERCASTSFIFAVHKTSSVRNLRVSRTPPIFRHVCLVQHFACALLSKYPSDARIIGILFPTDVVANSSQCPKPDELPLVINFPERRCRIVRVAVQAAGSRKMRRSVCFFDPDLCLSLSKKGARAHVSVVYCLAEHSRSFRRIPRDRDCEKKGEQKKN